MKFDQKAFGQRIRVLRQRRGLTQAQMATALHINIDHLGRIELGKRGVSIDLLLDIAAMLNVSMDFLSTGTDHSSKSTVELISQIREILAQFEVKG